MPKPSHRFVCIQFYSGISNQDPVNLRPDPQLFVPLLLLFYTIEVNPSPTNSKGPVVSSYLYKMVAQNILSTYRVKLVFFERKKIGFNDSVDVNECL